MARTAASLDRRPRWGKPLPCLLAFTDPVRTPDVEALAGSLPRGAALVFRPFGAPDAEPRARRLKSILHARGALLMVGGDLDLAIRVRADGLHLPERLAGRALRWRSRAGLLTAAAHSSRAARVRGVDAVVVSTVFASASRSAGRPMGVMRLCALVRSAASPVYALGGVNDLTAGRLRSTGVVGLAGIDGFRT